MIVADSSYFIALADKNDQWHRNAVAVKSRIPQEFKISTLTVSEAVTAIGYRAGGKAARTLYDYFADNCSVETVDRQLMDLAMTVHLRFDGILSVADSVSAAIMTRDGFRQIVSFDSDFDKIKGIQRIY
ncbi:MAG: PIN domain-containing protein [Candidatus Thermoplasmatota archaeon]|nr:PIN domain-containing protein [Candidatus Sysuiplasma jiujiangense]MBX8641281.1 PIN domain-containing protein [Candidatus Sysuiplasma jiujiangense]MCL4317225.1 PIN domain-containing protein [Candidatus Thermoplasmatota archaeon]